jgi:tetratricopeptide (TPR) repeat protein
MSLLKGTLSRASLPGLLGRFHVEARSGLLRFLRGEERRGFLYRHGAIVHAATNVEKDRLGELLVKKRKLKKGEFDRASQILREQGRPLGGILVEMGVLDEAGLALAIDLHVKRVLAGLDAWDEGFWEFLESADEPDVGQDADRAAFTTSLVAGAIAKVKDAALVLEALGNLDRALVFREELPASVRAVKLQARERRLLAAADGTRPAREVLAAAGGKPGEAERSLYRLVSLGLVAWLPWEAHARPPAAPPAPEPPVPEPPVAEPSLPAIPAAPAVPPDEAADGSTSPWESAVAAASDLAAGVEAPPRPASLEESIPPATETPHPDPALWLPEPEDQAPSAAPEPPPAPEPVAPAPPPPYEPPEPAVAPEPWASWALRDPVAQARADQEALDRAAVFIGIEKHWDAIQLLEPLVKTSRSQVTRHKASLLMARAFIKNPKWMRRAEQALRAVVDEDPAHAEAHFLLGQVYRDEGLKARAESMFRRVLELRPGHKGATEELKALSGQSFFKKLFGKW